VLLNLIHFEILQHCTCILQIMKPKTREPKTREMYFLDSMQQAAFGPYIDTFRL